MDAEKRGSSSRRKEERDGSNRLTHICATAIPPLSNPLPPPPPPSPIHHHRYTTTTGTHRAVRLARLVHRGAMHSRRGLAPARGSQYVCKHFPLEIPEKLFLFPFFFFFSIHLQNHFNIVYGKSITI